MNESAAYKTLKLVEDTTSTQFCVARPKRAVIWNLMKQKLPWKDPSRKDFIQEKV
ncbi:hypothetical protein [Wolbachia endosymbiont of Pentidionis agamae]|uniref:hypothetical protein n=1 Tax=Wolbachia endosymbiont of Pentidionis agamae TaxID=3110435 RepID=UPI002FD420DF